MVRLQPLSQGRRPAYQAAAAPPVTMEALRTGAITQPSPERATAPQILEALQKPQPRPPRPPEPPPAPAQQVPALRENQAKNQNKQSGTQAAKLPAPIQGWYTAASIAEAPPGTALIIENWFCEYSTPPAMRRRCMPSATAASST
jgi:hypothetical protein